MFKNRGFELLNKHVLMAFLSTLAGVHSAKAFADIEEMKGVGVAISYTNCKDRYDSYCKDEILSENKTCYCYIYFNITESIQGPVTLYYHLPDFDQTRPDYMNSKNDDQLAGKLSSTANCGNFSTDDTPVRRPIAPCGEIADSMLLDTYDIFLNNTAVPYIQSGFSEVTKEDRTKYHNPNGPLSIAFQNFSKPKSWWYDVATTLYAADQNSSGFQNDRFIAWMNTDLKVKPALRYNYMENGTNALPAGTYKFRVRYYPSKYITGTRRVIITRDLEAIRPLFSAAPTEETTSVEDLTRKEKYSLQIWAIVLISIALTISILAFLVALDMKRSSEEFKKLWIVLNVRV